MMNEDKARGGSERGPDAALGAAIIELRERRGLSRAELARRAELDPADIGGIESGGLEPTWGDLRRIAQGLDEPLESLLELAERLEQGTS